MVGASLKSADTYMKLLWKPRPGDKVKLNGIKDTIALVQEDSIYLSKFPQHPYRAHHLQFRPTPQQYLEVIKLFMPNIVVYIEEKAQGRYLIRIQGGPFGFIVEGRPKQLLANLLSLRLHLVAVNEAVNQIFEMARNAGIKNVPHLRIVSSSATE